MCLQILKMEKNYYTFDAVPVHSEVTGLTFSNKNNDILINNLENPIEISIKNHQISGASSRVFCTANSYGLCPPHAFNVTDPKESTIVMVDPLEEDITMDYYVSFQKGIATSFYQENGTLPNPYLSRQSKEAWTVVIHYDFTEEDLPQEVYFTLKPSGSILSHSSDASGASFFSPIIMHVFSSIGGQIEHKPGNVSLQYNITIMSTSCVFLDGNAHWNTQGCQVNVNSDVCRLFCKCLLLLLHILLCALFTIHTLIFILNIWL